jgi:hypothetical protein
MLAQLPNIINREKHIFHLANEKSSVDRGRRLMMAPYNSQILSTQQHDPIVY